MGYQTTTTGKGRRFSAARAFLSPIRDRSNLDIVTDTDVRRILFTNKRATGVVIRDKAGERTVKVGQEIILSAGAIQSPQLLQLSGIGPAALLSSLGIAVADDAPDVGRHLLEHRYLSPQYRVQIGRASCWARDCQSWVKPGVARTVK